ncbi:MAG: spore germination protein GerW family protein [Anaerolineae bacterium]
MSLDRLFEVFEELREKAHVNAVFGQPQEAGGKTIIPIAQVSYGFGLGFGEGERAGEEKGGKGSGAGGGGGASVRPLALLEVKPEGLKLIPVIDYNKVLLAGILFAAWAFFWGSRMGRTRPEIK